jgi:hypothetical protein
VIEVIVTNGELFEKLESLSKGGEYSTVRYPVDHPTVYSYTNPLRPETVWEDWNRTFLPDGRLAWIRKGD